MCVCVCVCVRAFNQANAFLVKLSQNYIILQENGLNPINLRSCFVHLKGKERSASNLGH